VLGALIIGSLENGLDLRSQGSDIKQMIEGGVLLFAVAIDALVRRAQAASRHGS
jgi:D-xylose transport system permease protein